MILDMTRIMSTYNVRRVVEGDILCVRSEPTAQEPTRAVNTRPCNGSLISLKQNILMNIIKEKKSYIIQTKPITNCNMTGVPLLLS